MINKGYFFGDGYFKQVRFSKAVLWKDKQLSLPLSIMDKVLRNGIITLTFKDPVKKEKWIFKVEKVKELMIKKRVGQEEQYYFPIELAKKELI